MKKALLIGSAYLLPVLVGAQSLSGVETLAQSVQRIMNNYLIPIVFALAVLYFFWGLAQYILNAGNEVAQTDGRSKMIWGIVALFVMASIWGLVRFLGTSLGINQDSAPVVNPLIPR